VTREPLTTKIFHRGFFLLEGILVLAIISLVVVVTVGELLYSQRVSARAAQSTRASDLAVEGLEALKNIRDADFFALADGTHGLKLVEGRWALALNAPETIASFFQRRITITSPTDYQKRAEIVVTWPGLNGSGEVKLVTEFSNWFATVEDWSKPKAAGEFNLTPDNSGSNNHKVRTIRAKNNYLYVGNDNSAGKEFLTFDLTEAPTINIKSALDLGGNPNGISILGQFAFIVSDANDQELQVVDLRQLTRPALVASFDLPGNDDLLSSDIDFDNNLLIVGRKFGWVYLFDVSTPSRPLLVGQLTLTGDSSINALRFFAGRVLLAASDGTIRLIDVNQANSPRELASLRLPGCLSALSLDLTASRFYAGCSGHKSNAELFVGLWDASSLLFLSQADVGGSQADVEHISFAATEKFVFLLTGDQSADFQVWNVANDLNPTRFSTFNLAGSPSQADYSPLVQKMFVGMVSDPEIQVVAPELVLR